MIIKVSDTESQIQTDKNKVAEESKSQTPANQGMKANP